MLGMPIVTWTYQNKCLLRIDPVVRSIVQTWRSGSCLTGTTQYHNLPGVPTDTLDTPAHYLSMYCNIFWVLFMLLVEDIFHLYVGQVNLKPSYSIFYVLNILHVLPEAKFQTSAYLGSTANEV